MDRLPSSLGLVIIEGDLWVFALTILGAAVIIAAARKFVLGLPERGGYRGQLVLFFVVLIGLLSILIAIPLEPDLRSQVFQLVSIVLSAAIALSSTTFLGNLIAGGMLRTVRHFELGDWVRVGEHFGRVTERGLLHTEIQTETRDLTTLPNLFLATHAVQVVQPSGTIISVNVGIGYDVPHARIETALLRAATTMGLVDAFVAVDELGDYAVTYRIAGLCTDVDRMLSKRSGLRRTVLDALHEDGIEIMSPAFHNVLQRERTQVVIPDEIGGARQAPKAPEAVAFDKADAAKILEEKRETVEAMNRKVAEIDERMGDLEGEERQALDWERARIRGEAKRLEAEIAEEESADSEG